MFRYLLPKKMEDYIFYKKGNDIFYFGNSICDLSTSFYQDQSQYIESTPFGNLF